MLIVKTRGENQVEAAEVPTKKRKAGHQQSITKYTESNTIEPSKKQICDRTVAKFFICCEVAFHLIEHRDDHGSQTDDSNLSRFIGGSVRFGSRVNRVNHRLG